MEKTVTNPIHYNGIAYRAQKRFFQGTHRILSPEETYDNILTYPKKIGLTRIPHITGLDRIGIPVTLAIRPNALTLATSAGKGISLKAAMVSAIMESLEVYHAEVVDLPVQQASYNQIKQEAPVIALDKLPLRKNSLFHPDWPQTWTLGWDLIGQKQTAVPFFSISMNDLKARAIPTEMRCFLTESNGLASGNHFLEALASALYEVIERDAVSCHLFGMENFGLPLCQVDLDTIPFTSVQNLLERLNTARFKTFLFDCTVDTDIPVFMAFICDAERLDGLVVQGYGAHLDPEVAMLRAITEAVQAHTVIISGSRDDCFGAKSKQMKKADPQKIIRIFSRQEDKKNAGSYASHAASSFEEDVHLILEKLQQVGFSQVIALDITQQDFTISVVRVLIPGMESYYYHKSQHHERAQTYCMKRVWHKIL